jgi:hypothetical protein
MLATSPDGIESLKLLKPFPQIAKLIEPSRNGKPVHVATLGRWRDPGVRAKDGSRIRLRAVRFPAGWRTKWPFVIPGDFQIVMALG